MNVEILVPIAGMATGVILFLPLVRAVVRHIERRGQGSPAELAALRDDVQALRERVGQLQETLEGRVLEIEERVDFAERMLAKRDEARRLGGGEGA